MTKRVNQKDGAALAGLQQADPAQKNKWVRYTYPNLKKKPGAKGR